MLSCCWSTGAGVVDAKGGSYGKSDSMSQMMCHMTNAIFANTGHQAGEGFEQRMTASDGGLLIGTTMASTAGFDVILCARCYIYIYFVHKPVATVVQWVSSKRY